MAAPRTFPQTLKGGSVSVKIYMTPVNGHEAYTLSYYEAGRRRRVVRSKYGDAKREAEDIIRQLNRGIAPGQQLTGEDREAYLSARSKLEPLGASLNEAILEYTAARASLGDRASIREAVRFFLAHAPDRTRDIAVGEAYELYLKRAEARTSGRNVEGVKLHIGRFAGAFNCRMSDVSHVQIDQWMRRLGYGGRYFNNCRSALITFFRWCRKHRYLPDMETEAEKVEKRREVEQSVTIFTPAVMKTILAQIREDLIPYISLSAFGGLRPSEARRLEWANINWDEDYIEIHASVARKTLRDRFVPLHPNLRSWLEPFRTNSGRVAFFKGPHEMLTRAVKDLRCIDNWPEDVLRHSYGSYRLAILKDSQKVASEMGNSPEVIVKNYRRPVSDSAAREWFGIDPAKS